MKKIYILFGIILLVLLVLGCSGTNNTATDTKSDNSQPATAEPTTQPTPVKAEPVVIATWEGESIKNTETFHVPTDEWKISWDTKPGKFGDMNFIITVYKAGETQIPVSVAANVIGANNESTVIRGAGDYYLAINTGQPYKITVETV